MRQNSSPFACLTWLDLESWAGAKTVSRGKSYQRGRRVIDLAITGSGELVAWVQGSSRYATKPIPWRAQGSACAQTASAPGP